MKGAAVTSGCSVVSLDPGSGAVSSSESHATAPTTARPATITSTRSFIVFPPRRCRPASSTVRATPPPSDAISGTCGNKPTCVATGSPLPSGWCWTAPGGSSIWHPDLAGSVDTRSGGWGRGLPPMWLQFHRVRPRRPSNHEGRCLACLESVPVTQPFGGAPRSRSRHRAAAQPHRHLDRTNCAAARGPVDNGLRASARSDQRRSGSIGSDGSSPLCASAMSTTPSATTSEPRPERPRSAYHCLAGR